MTISDRALTALQEGRPSFVDRNQSLVPTATVGSVLAEIERTLGIPIEQLDVRDIGHYGFIVEVK